MRKEMFLSLILLFINLIRVTAQQREVPVFVSGTEGYKTFRIPAFIRLPNNHLLAFCEGRVDGPADFGKIDIVMKRSQDDGKTWSALQVVVNDGQPQLSNPAPVLDLTDPAFPGGRLFLFYNPGNSREADVLRGKGVKHCLYKTSADGGATWASAVDITLEVHRPKQPVIDPAFNFEEDWRYYANTPGHAMQFKEGPYKGRIFVAANHTVGNPLPGSGNNFAHGYYTDDHGKTFKLGNSISVPGSNESTAAELPDGKLMMNSRNQRGNIKARIVSVSSDGGTTWDTSYLDTRLPDPVCEGSLLSLDKGMLAFSNAADTTARNNLTVSISKNGGRTWTKRIQIYKGNGRKPGYAYAAYSDMVQLGRRKIGLLYEKDQYSSIVFTAIDF